VIYFFFHFTNVLDNHDNLPFSRIFSILIDFKMTKALRLYPAFYRGCVIQTFFVIETWFTTHKIKIDGLNVRMEFNHLIIKNSYA
jgi:hypothetical protein